MANGKEITIHLLDGSITGIRTGEVMGHIIKSFVCKRERVRELMSNNDANKPCVYFLFGEDDERLPKTYIGHAEKIFNRLPDHLSKKKFWNEVIIFVSKDENFDSSHFKYLESRIIQMAERNGYPIENDKPSNPPSLTVAKQETLEEFLNYIKWFLCMFGHKEFAEQQLIKTFENSLDPSLAVSGQNIQVELELNQNVASVKIIAKAIQTEEGLVVLRGSEAAQEAKDKLQKGYRELRNHLINNGTLVLDGNKYIFKKNYLFNAASPAAAIITGGNRSGPESWKDKSGKTLKKIEQEITNNNTKSNNQKKGSREKVSVTFPDNTIINHKKVTNTFVEAIKKIGPEKIKELNIIRSGVPLVSEKKDKKYSQHQLGSYWIMVNTSTPDKIKTLQEINQKLNLKLNIETINN